MKVKIVQSSNVWTEHKIMSLESYIEKQKGVLHDHMKNAQLTRKRIRNTRKVIRDLRKEIETR